MGTSTQLYVCIYFRFLMILKCLKNTWLHFSFARSRKITTTICATRGAFLNVFVYLHGNKFVKRSIADTSLRAINLIRDTQLHFTVKIYLCLSPSLSFKLHILTSECTVLFVTSHLNGIKVDSRMITVSVWWQLSVSVSVSVCTRLWARFQRIKTPDSITHITLNIYFYSFISFEMNMVKSTSHKSQ